MKNNLFSKCFLLSLWLCLWLGAGILAQPKAKTALTSEVTVYRDNFGVPHIFGKTDASVVFGLMYAQGEDNFWQLETDLIRALGRQAEVEGEKGLANDLSYRAFEIERLSRAEYAALPAATRVLCDAWAAGLNHFIAKHPQTPPRLIARFEGWQVLALSRSGRRSVNNIGLRSDEIKFAERVDLPESRKAATQTREPLDLTAFASWFADASLAQEGSNMWALAPSKSASGNALLFINPHVAFFGGGQRYEAQLKSEQGLNAYGFAILGTPYIRSGFNEHLGWSHTNNYADVADLYLLTIERPSHPLEYTYENSVRTIKEWTEEVKVKVGSSVETRRYRFRKSHHGPIIGQRDGQPVAVRIAKLAEGGEVQQRFAMNRARNWKEFEAALSQRALTGSNTLYADSAGNIFYVHGNAIPRREPSTDWSKPVSGSDPANEWRGYHAFSELPQYLNPVAGWLQNCNSTPFLTMNEGNLPRDKFPEYLAPEPDTPRARNSRRLLSSQAKFTYDELTRFATDTTIDDWRSGVEYLTAEWQKLKNADEARAEKIKPALLALQAWDGRAHVNSVAATLYVLWLDGSRDARDNRTFRDLAHLEKIVAKLEESFGSWQVKWGEINRLQRVFTDGTEPFSDAKKSWPVAGAPSYSGTIFTFNAREEKGQQRRYGISGNSFLAVVEFGKSWRAASMLVLGQSADPASKHHTDQAALYAEGSFKPVSFTLADIKRNLEKSYTLNLSRQK